MTVYDQDNPDLYKFDVTATTLPPDKQEWASITGAKGPALNAGVVELRCFINSHCPFVKVAKQEDVLVFSHNTLNNDLINTYFDSEFKSKLTTTIGTEGLHFIPKYVYRHNYIIDTSDFDMKQLIKELEETGTMTLPDLDDYYSEIQGQGPISANYTRYKDDQTWIVVPSVFDWYYLDKLSQNESSEETDEEKQDLEYDLCLTRPSWIYTNKTRESQAGEADIKLDYKNDFYKNFRNEIKPNSIQMPSQSNVQHTLGEGIHWRLEKLTQLYRGEDFFIEFHKEAKAPNVNTSETEPIPFFSKNGFTGDSNNFHSYLALDVSYPSNKAYVSNYAYGPLQGDFKEAFNQAVRSPDTDNTKGDYTTFNFIDQAYYVVEVGYGKRMEENYFIIICERYHPVFIHVKNGISYLLGVAKYIDGRALINQDYFTMTVRNHLNTLVIEFKSGELTTIPWIIQRVDRIAKYVFESERIGQNTAPWVMTEEDVPLTIPRGIMTVWGGNILCSFTFGPLQYISREIRFIYPPCPIQSEKDVAGKFGSTHQAQLDTVFPIPQYFSLPLGVKWFFKFSSSDLDVQDILKYHTKPDQPLMSQKLFTQDAQFYRNFISDASATGPGWDSDYSSKTPEEAWEYGSFYGNDTIKELTYTFGNNGLTDSLLSTWYFTSFNYREGVRTLEFNILIMMTCGDHVFSGTNLTPSEEEERRKYKRQVVVTNEKVEDIESWSDDEWVVLSCKTPVLNMIRLISDEDGDPRWDDTTGEGNYGGVPNDDNPFFIDATDHVLEYNDSWAASDFTSIEHTGSIKFLIYPVVEFGPKEDKRASQSFKLLALQNKTFYVDIWGGYDSTGVECIQTECTDQESQEGCVGALSRSNYTRIPGFYKLFTGLCHGGEISHSYGKKIMTCKIYDYSKILQDQLFFNSPWFDGVKDVNAVSEILSFAGFRSKYPFDTGTMLRKVARDENYAMQNEHTGIDNRRFYIEPYTLPSSYKRLEQPSFKFQDGSKFSDAISQIAKRAGKVFYFDQHGIAHYEDYLDMIIQSIQGTDLDPLFLFTTFPKDYPGQLIFNKIDINYSVQDVYNHIKLFSNTPNMTPMFKDQLNWLSMEDPDSEGFIGYLKTFYQEEGMFGSKEALDRMSQFYTVMFSPPITYAFETYGLPMRALDMISVNRASSRVMKVDSTINPSENKWWMTVETERFQPVRDIENEF